MTIHLAVRLLLMSILALVGLKVGYLVFGELSPDIAWARGLCYGTGVLLGGLIGFFGAPYVSVVPFHGLRQRVSAIPARSIIMGSVGLIMGLITAALLAYPLSMLPGLWGQVLPVVSALILGSLGVMVMVMRDRDILSLLGLVMGRDGLRHRRNLVLMDTSVIIDGRVADIQQAGFIRGSMIVPRFVLDELQHVADSADILRRNRGRRGLDVLNKMQKDERIPLEITDRDIPEVHEVDAKLVKMAQMMDCPILTND